MKKLILLAVLGLLVAPLSAWGQQWVDPYYKSDGTYVAGHWKTPEDARQDRYFTPGQVNPYTGRFNPYTGSLKSSQPPPPSQQKSILLQLPDFRPHYKIPGSSVKSPK
jgi:hypothetical protein